MSTWKPRNTLWKQPAIEAKIYRNALKRVKPDYVKAQSRDCADKTYVSRYASRFKG